MIRLCEKLAVSPRPSVSQAVLEDLQELVENGRVGLLDLVEEQHAERLFLHAPGELAALLVADETRGRAGQPLGRVLLGVLTHVKPGERALVAEDQRRDRLGELRLADAGRADEEEDAARAACAPDEPKSTPAYAVCSAWATAFTATS